MYMDPASSLVWNPPPWPELLAGVAAVMILVEVIMLALWCQRGGSAAGELFLTAAGLFAGPLLATAGLMLVATTASTGRTRGATAVVVGLRGTALAALAVLVWSWPTGGGILAIAASAAAWSLRSYGRTTRPLSRRRKAFLLLLRMTAILAATAWIMQPVLQHVSREHIPPVFILGLDHSASMQRRDMTAEMVPAGATGTTGERISRTKAMIGALESAGSVFSAMTERETGFRAFSFSRTVHTASDAMEWAALLKGPPGQATAIGDAAAAALGPPAAEGADIRGIVLFSDGCNNTIEKMSPVAFARRMDRRDIAVHTVGVGSDTATTAARAITVLDTGAPDTASAFRRMAIAPRIRVIGLDGRRLKVTCRFGDETVGTTELQIAGATATPAVRFEHIPLDAGFHRLAITAELVGEKPEELDGNPQAGKLVHVTDRETRILYIEGKYRYESKFITRAIGTEKKYAIHRVTITGPAAGGTAALPGDDLDEWLRYHAVILGDIAPDTFSPRQIEIMRTLVLDYGKGLCMIGGTRSFGNGVWQKTPLADVIPIDCAASTGDIKGPIKPLPTAEGRRSSIMRIAPGNDDLRDAWNALRPMPGANKLAGVKPAATILAEYENTPMIVSQRVGTGRSLAVAFDTTWRWALSPPPERPGAVDGAAVLRRFWRQVAEFLAAPRGNLWVHTDRIEYDLTRLRKERRTIDITAGIEDARGVPVVGTQPQLTLTVPGGTTTAIPVTIDRKNRRFTASLPPPGTPGTYTIDAAADINGKPMKAKQVFVLQYRNLESRDVLADFDLLRNMADIGRGRFVPLAQLEELLHELDSRTEPNVKKIYATEDLLAGWRWPLIIFIIVLLCAEWTLRKRWGLV